MDIPLWRKIQKESFSKISEISDFLQLDESNNKKLLEKPSFRFLLPRRIAEKIPKNNLSCPLSKQFLPLKEELIKKQGFISDPTCDAIFQKEEKILHKYQGRLLLITTGACAMNCRFCFRQNFSYPQTKPIFERELAYIKQESSLHEVILSGGDPLSLSDETLQKILQALDAIDHIQIIRFHTRFPIGIPERITPSFLEILSRLKKQIIFVIHANHANEFDQDIFQALKSLRLHNVQMLMHTVLLKGINDDLTSLKNLFLTVSANGIFPYYLHQLDQVEGTTHFYTPIKKGLFLIDELRKILPGYATPRYVQEIPNAPYTTIL
jgi:EF-P beta-lysylation protein EpmB